MTKFSKHDKVQVTETYTTTVEDDGTLYLAGAVTYVSPSEVPMGVAVTLVERHDNPANDPVGTIRQYRTLGTGLALKTESEEYPWVLLHEVLAGVSEPDVYRNDSRSLGPVLGKLPEFPATKTWIQLGGTSAGNLYRYSETGELKFSNGDTSGWWYTSAYKSLEEIAGSSSEVSFQEV